MTKKKEKEEDIIEQKVMKKETEEELKEVEIPEAEAAEEVPETAEELTETERLEKQAAEYLDGWKRCQADFENYKKRQAESAKDLIRYASENLIMQIIPVLDNFQMSTEHIPEDQKDGGWVVGIMHIQKQLEKVLEENGVSEIKVKVGDKFDPTVHEAVSNDQGEKELKNKIAKIIQKGYKIDSKVIRPARVIVE